MSPVVCHNIYCLIQKNRELISMDDSIKNSDEVKMAKQAFVSFRESNYVRFFKCVKNCSYLQGALLHRYFNQVIFFNMFMKF